MFEKAMGALHERGVSDQDPKRAMRVKTADLEVYKASLPPTVSPPIIKSAFSSSPKGFNSMAMCAPALL